MSKNEATKLMLGMREARRIDSLIGARSLWLGPPRVHKSRRSGLLLLGDGSGTRRIRESEGPGSSGGSGNATDAWYAAYLEKV